MILLLCSTLGRPPLGCSRGQRSLELVARAQQGPEVREGLKHLCREERLRELGLAPGQALARGAQGQEQRPRAQPGAWEVPSGPQAALLCRVGAQRGAGGSSAGAPAAAGTWGWASGSAGPCWGRG